MSLLIFLPAMCCSIVVVVVAADVASLCCVSVGFAAAVVVAAAPDGVVAAAAFVVLIVVMILFSSFCVSSLRYRSVYNTNSSTVFPSCIPSVRNRDGRNTVREVSRVYLCESCLE